MSRPPGVELQTRLIGTANATLGAVLLARPRDVARAAAAGDCPPGAVWVRLLGGRYLAQGATQLAWPTSTALRLSVAVDCLHAASMLALAAVRAEYRRPAMVSAAVATGSAVVTWIHARRTDRARP